MLACAERIHQGTIGGTRLVLVARPQIVDELLSTYGLEGERCAPFAELAGAACGPGAEEGGAQL